jgi:UDP-N-acetylglucosamine 2-epimerase
LGFLVGSDTKLIIDTFEKLDTNYETFKELHNPYGDGRTSERVVKLLQHPEVIKFLKHYPDNAETVFDIKELL